MPTPTREQFLRNTILHDHGRLIAKKLTLVLENEITELMKNKYKFTPEGAHGRTLTQDEIRELTFDFFTTMHQRLVK